MQTAGIDEAGRGPVIGPLVMAGVAASEEKIERLKELGVKDSKLLTREERETMYYEILKIVDSYKIISLTPDVIDETLSDPKTNLNKLEAITSAQIIDALNPDKVILDLPDRDAFRYVSIIRSSLAKKEVEIIAEHKADLNYPIVSAASILAKVTRDRYVDFLKEQFGEDFGSGYTSDPKTQKFLEKHWNNDKIHFFRKNWATIKNLKKEKEQKKLFDF
ncbi:MAG: ribonuclease HII [archaeon]